MLATHMGALTEKMDTLTQIVHIMHQLTSICEGCRTNHTTINCPIAFTHTRYSTHKIFKGSITILTPTHIIQVEEIIQIFMDKLVSMGGVPWVLLDNAATTCLHDFPNFESMLANFAI